MPKNFGLNLDITAKKELRQHKPASLKWYAKSAEKDFAEYRRQGITKANPKGDVLKPKVKVLEYPALERKPFVSALELAYPRMVYGQRKKKTKKGEMTVLEAERLNRRLWGI